MRSTVVCGVDRSPHARAAARLAGVLARRLGLDLELVHVLDSDSRPASSGAMAALQAVLQEDLDLNGTAVQLKTGVVSKVLAEAGRRAPLLVIGTRGEGALRRAVLGSVSATLTRDPRGPVVVVPPGATAADPPLGGRAIVCGVRDERDSAPAHAAARMAADLGLTLTLAHVLGPPATAVSAAGGAPTASMLRPTAAELDAAMRTLEGIARSINANIPAVVGLAVLDGRPGPQLDRLAAASDAAILAVGACDHGPLAGALAGTPPQHLMSHGTRPMLICPRPQRLDRMRAPARQISPMAS